MVQVNCLNEKVNGVPKKVEILNPVYDVYKPRGSIRASGKCPSCGGKVSGFVKKAEVPAEVRAKSDRILAASKLEPKVKRSKGSKSSKSSKGSKSGGGGKRNSKK